MARVAVRDVAVAAEELAVGMRAVVVEDLFAGTDGAQRGDGESIVAVVDVCLFT